MSLVPAGITPDRFTFNALLEAHAAAGSLEGASKIYDAMAQRRIPPDICTFIALFQVLPSPLMAAHPCVLEAYPNISWKDVSRCPKMFTRQLQHQVQHTGPHLAYGTGAIVTLL